MGGWLSGALTPAAAAATVAGAAPFAGEREIGTETAHARQNPDRPSTIDGHGACFRSSIALPVVIAVPITGSLSQTVLPPVCLGKRWAKRSFPLSAAAQVDDTMLQTVHL